MAGIAYLPLSRTTKSSSSSSSSSTSVFFNGSITTTSITSTSSTHGFTTTSVSNLGGYPATAQTTNSTLGLDLIAQVNTTSIQQGQTINLYFSIQNLQAQINNLTGESNWAFPSLENFSYAVIPCPRWDTFRVYSGYYSQSNLSNATPLFLWPTAEGAPSCPFWNFTNYIFQPSSTVVNVSNTSPANYDLSFSTAEYHNLTGSYPAVGGVRSVTFPSPTLFPVGVYTVVVADEWGQFVTIYFDVTPGVTTSQTDTDSVCQAVGRINSTISAGVNTTIGGPIAYDSHNNEFYATGNSFNYEGPGLSNSVFVINPSTNSTSAAIAVGNSPTDIAFDSNNNNLYVTNFGSNSVSVINDSTNKIIGNVSVGAGPIRIFYDQYNNELYVSNRVSGTVSVINATTNVVASNITVNGSPFEIVYDSFNHDLYVTDGASGNVTIIDSNSNKVVGGFSLGQGSGLAAYDSANNYLYFFPQDSQVLYVMNGSSNQVIGNVSGIYDLNALGYNPSNHDIYAAGNASNGFLYVISGDSANGSQIVSSLFGYGWVPVDFMPVNGSMYLGTNYGNAIYVLSSQGTNTTCTNSNSTVTYLGGGTVTTIMTTSDG